MGLLDFVAGAAQKGSDLLSAQSLEAMKVDAEVSKAQRIMEAQRASTEAQRQQTQTRQASYAQPITSTVPGVPAASGAMDYEGEDGPAGNPVATQDTTTSRAPTFGEVARNAVSAGDFDAAKLPESFQSKDDQVTHYRDMALGLGQRAQIRADAEIKGKEITAKSRTDVAAARAQNELDKIDAKLYDENGNRIPPNGQVIAQIQQIGKGINVEMNVNQKDAAQAQKAINEINSQILTGMIATKKPEQKAAVEAELAKQQGILEKAKAALVDLHATRDDANKKFGDFIKPQTKQNSGLISSTQPGYNPGDARPDEQPDATDSSVSPAQAATRYLDALGGKRK